MTFKWTPEAKAKVADMLEQGKPASVIGAAIGVSRNCIISIVHRDAELHNIGFTKPGERGKPAKLTQEQIDANRRQGEKRRKERMREYQRAYAAQQRGVVIPFPAPTRALPANSPRIAKPRLSVVSNNVPLMVQDWLEKNGGARKFDERETTDSWSVRSFLAERGVQVGFVRGSDKWSVTRNGRPRIVKWADIMALVDEIRIAEGLQPFAVGATKSRWGAVG